MKLVIISIILFYCIAIAGGGFFALSQYEPWPEVISAENTGNIEIAEIENVENETDVAGLGFFKTFADNALTKFKDKTEQVQAEDEEEYLFIKKKRREFRRIQDRASL